MKTVWLVLGLLILGAMGISAIAQDAPPAPELCAPTALDEALVPGYEGSAKEAFAQAQTNIDTALASGDMEGFLTWMRTLKVFMSFFDAKCRGLAFSNDVDGLQPVIGPVAFPDGFWRAHFNADAGYTAVKFTAVEGDCDPMETSLLFQKTAPTDGSESQPVEALFKTEGCVALIEIEPTAELVTWTLSFEMVAAAR